MSETVGSVGSSLGTTGDEERRDGSGIFATGGVAGHEGPAEDCSEVRGEESAGVEGDGGSGGSEGRSRVNVLRDVDKGGK